MKNIKNFLFVIICAAFLSGCYYTIEPVYLEKDKITDDAIPGTWGKPKEKGSWTFIKDEKEKAYNLIFLQSDGVKSTVKATLVKIGKYKYLDMLVDNRRIENQTGMFKAMLLGFHYFIRYYIENEKLMFVDYDLTWIDKKLKNNEIELHYFVRDSGYFFSDSTETLQKAIISLEDTKEAFSKDLTTLERIK